MTGFGVHRKVTVNLGEPVMDAVDRQFHDQETVLSEQERTFVSPDDPPAPAATLPPYNGPHPCSATNFLTGTRVCRYPIEYLGPAPIQWTYNFGGGNQFRASGKYCTSAGTTASTMQKFGAYWTIGEETTTEKENVACQSIGQIGPNNTRRFTADWWYLWEWVRSCTQLFSGETLCELHQERNPSSWSGTISPSTNNTPRHDLYETDLDPDDCIRPLVGPAESAVANGSIQKFEISFGKEGEGQFNFTAHSAWYSSKSANVETRITWNFDGDNDPANYEPAPHHYLYVQKGSAETPPKCWVNAPGRAWTHVSNNKYGF